MQYKPDSQVKGPTMYNVQPLIAFLLLVTMKWTCSFLDQSHDMQRNSCSTRQELHSNECPTQGWDASERYSRFVTLTTGYILAYCWQLTDDTIVVFGFINITKTTTTTPFDFTSNLHGKYSG